MMPLGLANRPVYGYGRNLYPRYGYGRKNTAVICTQKIVYGYGTGRIRQLRFTAVVST